MPIIITITNEITAVDNSTKIYNYSDKILKNICKNEYEIFYSGQNKGILDKDLIYAIHNKELFKDYFRKKKSVPYQYLGCTFNTQILESRKKPLNQDTIINERLKIKLIVKNIDYAKVQENNFKGTGRYKKDVLVHAGLRNSNNKVIFKHNQNTNLGFYYYNEN